MQHQLDATIRVLLISKISSTCFGQTFAHLQERKTEIFYNIWYNALLMWQAGFLSVVAWHYVYGMKVAVSLYLCFCIYYNVCYLFPKKVVIIWHIYFLTHENFIPPPKKNQGTFRRCQLNTRACFCKSEFN
jgi:hypothetical protein